tara:strand:+ start:11846 stop:13819 length:1974 start_codon:yes stop_codon:yes gene_type:complete
MSIFLKISGEDKESKIKEGISKISKGEISEQIFIKNAQDFSNVPTSPFCYWAPQNIIDLFSKFSSFEEGPLTAKLGASTKNNDRFVRLAWEVPVGEKKWKILAKGGEFSRWFSDYHLVVNWGENADEIEAELLQKFPYLGSSAEFVLHRKNSYFEPGLTWSQRTQKGFSCRVIPRGCIFTDKGPGATLSDPQLDSEDSILALTALCNSSTFSYLLGLQMSFGSYEVGVIQRTPLPDLSNEDTRLLANYARKGWELKRKYYESFETSLYFLIPNKLRGSSSKQEIDMQLKSIQNDIDVYCKHLYGLKDFPGLPESISDSVSSAKDTKTENDKAFISWCVGVLFGRFDCEELDSLLESNEYKTPFNTIEKISPAVKIALKKHSTLSAITCDNSNKENLSEKIQFLVKDLGQEISFSITDYISKSFFDDHIKSYTQSRRQAPVYWKISTVSGSFSIWIYYHKLNNQTLLQCVNNEVDVKLSQLESEIAILLNKEGRDNKEESRLNHLEGINAEVNVFKEELLTLIRFWQPNLNDGVQITAAPLWRLFQNKAWQKKLKQTWEQLQEGECDWSHLAFSTWPERVLKKCHEGRSLAIAHDVDNDLWHEVEVIKKNKKEPAWEWQPKPLSDAELHAYIKDKIATDERLKLYCSNNTSNLNGGKL